MHADLLQPVRDRFERIYREGRDAWTRVRLYPETVSALETALALEPGLAGGTVLDLGCGRGRMLRELHDRGFADRVAADLTREPLRDARRHASRAAVGADAAGLPFRDGSFDLVTELTLLSSLDPDLWPRVVQETARVLRPGGLFVTEQVQRPRGHPLREPVETACKLPRRLDLVWGFRFEDFERLFGHDFERVLLAEVPVRDEATDTPSWAGLFRKT